MKAYSLDFRQKIIDVYNKEEISQRQLAKRFDVALTCIIHEEKNKTQKIRK